MAVHQKTFLWLRLALLGLAIGVSHVACAGTVSKVERPTATVAPPSTQFRHELASPADNLDRLSSYRATYDIGYAGSRAGQQVSGQLELQTDVDRQHGAIRTAQTFQSPEQALQPVELVQLPDAFMLHRGDDWLWFRATEGQAIDPAEMGILTELEKFVVLPPVVSTPPVFETWQGRNVQKYVFTEQDLNAPEVVFSEAQGEMRVDVAGNYVAQYVLTATLEAQNVVPAAHLIDSGQLTLAYSISQPDAVTISLPKDALPVSNLLTALPRPVDAELTAIYPTLLEYTSTITPISATLYFGSQLPPLGWTQTITSVFQEKARLAFNHSNEDITILVAPGPDSNRNKVTVSRVTRP